MNNIVWIIAIMVLNMANKAVAWHNWAGNQVCESTQIIIPSSKKELQESISKAVRENKKIRAYGSGHSWSDIVCTDAYLIDTSKLNNVLSLDKKAGKIRVQAGIKLKDLVAYLAKHGLALPNQPAVLDQSIAGTLATATHGTGHTGTLADFVTEVELIAADGTSYLLSAQQEPDLFAASRVSIGSLGMVYAVTVHCEPSFMLEYRSEKDTLAAIKKKYKKLHQENDFFQFYIDPYSGDVSSDIWNRVTGNRTSGWLSKVRETAGRWGSSIVEPLLNWSPRLQRAATRWSVRASKNSNIKPSYKALSGVPGALYFEQEISVPVSQLDVALDATLKLLKEYEKKDIFVSTVLIRFVNAEHNSLLSPVAERNSAYVSVIVPAADGYEQLYRDMYHAVMPFGGRPHWGKINFLTKEDAQKAYGDNFEKFIAVRKQLDPNGVLSNAFTKRVFGW